MYYSKTCLKPPLKKEQVGFQYRSSLNAGQKYCRMLQGEHSTILLTFIKLPFSIKTFVLFIFKWVLLYILHFVYLIPVDHVIALYPYKAQHADELTFPKDAVINVNKYITCI